MDTDHQPAHMEAPAPKPPALKRGRGWRVLLLVLVVGGGAYLGLASRLSLPTPSPLPFINAKPATPAAAPSPIPVTVVQAAVQDLPISRSGLGTVTPLNQVDIKVRVDGQVQSIAFAEGQYVKAGDLLAQIDPRPYRAQLAQAEATLQKDTAQFDNARTEEARTARLSSSGAGTSQAADNAKAQVAITQAQVQGDQAAVDTAKLNLTFATITAPIAGRVGLKQVNEGAIVRASDATGIVTITQIRPIAVQFSLPQDDLPDLLAGHDKAGLRVSIGSRDGSRHLADGELTVVDSQVDTSTGMVKLKAEFDNADDALWPGALVAAQVVVRTDRNAVVVPSLAVQNGQRGSYVYLVKADGTVANVPVQLGAVVGDLTAITSGVALGDTLVLSGQSRLRQGTRVTVAQADAVPQHVAQEIK